MDYVTSFYSGKTSLAKCNLFTNKSCLQVLRLPRHCNILQGSQFTWVTNRKNLEHVLTQKNLSGQQARWIEKLIGLVSLRSTLLTRRTFSLMPCCICINLTLLVLCEHPEYAKNDPLRVGAPGTSDKPLPAVLSAPASGL